MEAMISPPERAQHPSIAVLDPLSPNYLPRQRIFLGGHRALTPGVSEMSAMISAEISSSAATVHVQFGGSEGAPLGNSVLGWGSRRSVSKSRICAQAANTRSPVPPGGPGRPGEKVFAAAPGSSMAVRSDRPWAVHREPRAQAIDAVPATHRTDPTRGRPAVRWLPAVCRRREDCGRDALVSRALLPTTLDQQRMGVLREAG